MILYTKYVFRTIKNLFFKKQGQTEQTGIFFISSGEVDLIYERKSLLDQSLSNEILVKELNKGRFFGELPFFVDSAFGETARSRTFSTIYKISREDFLKLLASYPKDYVRI